MIVTAGTKISKYEEKYVVDAVRHLGDPVKFNFYIKEFERRFAEYIGAKYAIATVNGTAALHLGLLAMGIGKGDEVILPDMTYIACANVIHYVGAKPVMADIDPDTWCLDPQSVKKRITKRTKAIMPVWMYGNVPNMNALLALGIPIIEDSCPAVGSYFGRKHAGTFGKVGCFSFQGAKILAIGEGGMMVTNDKRIYHEAKLMADMYTTKEFWQDKIGYMYEMNNVSAAVGLGQLEHIDELIKKKHEIHSWYLPLELNKDYETPNHWMTSATMDNATKLRHFLKRNGVDTRPFFTTISKLGFYGKYDNPVSLWASEYGVNFPSTVNLAKKDVDYVISKIKAYYKKSS